MGMTIRDVCPRCMSPKYKKNGHIHNGKQNHQCKECGRQFVDCFEQYWVSNETRELIERLLLERLSLRGICRAVGIGLKWLLGFIVTCFEALTGHPGSPLEPTPNLVTNSSDGQTIASGRVRWNRLELRYADPGLTGTWASPVRQRASWTPSP